MAVHRSGTAAWALAAVAVASLLAVVGPSAHGSVSAPSFVAPALVGGCAGATESDPFHGTLTVEGGSVPANATAGVPLGYAYWLNQSIVEQPGDRILASSCVEENGTVSTGANGSFAVAITLPGASCSRGVGGASFCTVSSGPYRATVPTPTTAPPTGYALGRQVNGSSVALSWVDELARLVVSPGGSIEVAAGAPRAFAAVGTMGNGTPSPLRPTFSWWLNGTGWNLTAPGAASGAATVVAPAASAVAPLVVVASAVVDGVVLATPAVTVNLTSIPTELEYAELNRTSIDVGEPVLVSVAAVGAPGYSYRATVDPGLSAAPVDASCATAPTNGTDDVDCTARVTYATAGTADPSVEVTNGYSPVAATMAAVTVAPGPELAATPAAPVGYAGSPVAISLAPIDGTGTGPFTGACLASGAGPTTCAPDAGPTWTFEPTYADPGSYLARAWALDATGANASLSVRVTVVAPLSVAPPWPTENATAGAPLALVSQVAGGALPARFWWNASDVVGTVDTGSLTADGPLALTFVPSTAGEVGLTLTVVDRLGTVVEASTTLVVAVPAATELRAVTLPPPGPVVVGTGATVAWQAFTVSGTPAATFSADAEIALTGPNGTADAGWVNASGFGPLPPLGGGAFQVPVGAWQDGALAVTVTFARSGAMQVALAGASLPTRLPPLAVEVAPDDARLVLSAPDVVDAGLRTNATLWRVADRFGDAVPGAAVIVETATAGAEADRIARAFSTSAGGSAVWVNWSDPGPGAATVTIVDAAGEVLLGPLAVPALPAGPGGLSPVLALALALPAGLVGAAVAATVRRRRRDPDDDPEAALARLAEGRSEVVALVRRRGPSTVGELERSWEDGRAPPDLADWIGALVSDGTLGAIVGSDGVARFALAPGPVGRPRVDVDAAAFDDGLARRAAATEDERAPPD